MLIEFYGAVMLPHIDFKLSRGSAALPPVVGVSQTKVALAHSERQTAFWQEFDIQEPEQQATKMGEVGDAAL